MLRVRLFSRDLSFSALLMAFFCSGVTLKVNHIWIRMILGWLFYQSHEDATSWFFLVTVTSQIHTSWALDFYCSKEYFDNYVFWDVPHSWVDQGTLPILLLNYLTFGSFSIVAISNSSLSGVRVWSRLPMLCICVSLILWEFMFLSVLIYYTYLFTWYVEITFITKRSYRYLGSKSLSWYSILKWDLFSHNAM